MSNFEKALAFTLQWEGGYCNDANDSGGETNKGVTHAVYDSYRRSKGLQCRSVRFLEDREMQDIYQNRYWIPAHCNTLPNKLAICQFDWAVNAGVGRAIKTLQQVVGTEVDGIWGNNSTACLKKTLNAVGENNLIKSYLTVRDGHYRAWGTGSQSCFLNGWLNRTAGLRRLLA